MNREWEAFIFGLSFIFWKEKAHVFTTQPSTIGCYKLSRVFVKDWYFATKGFPQEEKFALVQQIRRAAISVHLNIAEGCSRKSEVERKRFYEVARGSVIEIDAALDAASDLGYCSKDSLKELGLSMARCFSMLCKLIGR